MDWIPDNSTSLVPANQDDKIKKMLEDNIPPEAIAMRLGVDLKDVEALTPKSDELSAHDDPRALLDAQIDRILRTVDLMEITFNMRPSDKAASAISSLTATLQSLLRDRQAYQDESALVADIVSRILEPTMKELLISLSKESKELRTALSGSGVEYNRIDTAVKTYVRNVGKVYSGIYRKQIISLHDMFDVPSVMRPDDAPLDANEEDIVL